VTSPGNDPAILDSQRGTRGFDPVNTIGGLEETLIVVAMCGWPFTGPGELADPAVERTLQPEERSQSFTSAAIRC
jgi:hypothetical protein